MYSHTCSQYYLMETHEHILYVAMKQRQDGMGRVRVEQEKNRVLLIDTSFYEDSY